MRTAACYGYVSLFLLLLLVRDATSFLSPQVLVHAAAVRGCPTSAPAASPRSALGASSSLSGKKVSKLKPPSLTSDFSVDDFNAVVQKTYGRYPITVTRGSGSTLYDDVHNKSYLDCVAGIATCALGHGHPGLAKAVSAQISTVHHVSNLYYTPQMYSLAKWLTDNSVADKAFFCNSGAEANEGAIKLARRHAYDRGITDPVIIVAHNSFHGRTMGALSATAQPKYHKGFGYGGKMVPGFEAITYNSVEELKAKVEEINRNPWHLALRGRKRGVAAILMEPLQGEGGILPGSLPFFQLARELCDASGALLMFDEVQIGMGRSGHLWGYEYLGVTPDVFTSAKALGGGVPIGAMLARGKAATTFGPGDHASTYGGNPLACAAGLAVAQAICDGDILKNVRERSEQFVKGLNAIRARHPTFIKDVRGWGLLLGVEIPSDSAVVSGDVVSKAIEKGLLIVGAGPKVLRFVPPLIITEKETDSALAIFEESLVEVFKEKSGKK